MMVNCLDQLIDEPTHFMDGCVPTCVDLILTNNPQIFVNSGVIPSPDDHCKHQIIHGNLNLSVPCPPPYERKIWKYHLADTDMIKQSIKLINWDVFLQNKSVDEMSRCFTETLLKIMERYIPNKTKMVNDKDAP